MALPEAGFVFALNESQEEDQICAIIHRHSYDNPTSTKTVYTKDTVPTQMTQYYRPKKEDMRGERLGKNWEKPEEQMHNLEVKVKVLRQP